MIFVQFVPQSANVPVHALVNEGWSYVQPVYYMEEALEVVEELLNRDRYGVENERFGS